jgi:hypothetical protein
MRSELRWLRRPRCLSRLVSGGSTIFSSDEDTEEIERDHRFGHKLLPPTDVV